VLDEEVLRREEKARKKFNDDKSFDRSFEKRSRRDRSDGAREYRREDKPTPNLKATPLQDFPDIAMQRFRLDVGRRNHVKPGNIVGAIANEADLESKYIGEIEIRDEYSTVDLPADMPKGVMSILKKVHVAGRPLALSVFQGDDGNKHKKSDHASSKSGAPRKKSYNSKKRKSGMNPGSDYANKKRRDRGRK